MKTFLLASAIVAVVAACVPAGAQGFYGESAKAWRLSGSFDYLTGDTARDLLGNGFNVELERSLGDLENGNLSGLLGYRRSQRDTGGFSNDLNHFSVGVKWRTGPGASPATDGYFYGAGVGLAILDSNIRGSSDTNSGLEWRALAGLNFARSWFGEVDYVSPIDAQGININSLSVNLGYRF